MALQFAECAQCHETHAVRANGEMSIHTTAAGDRCAPPVRVQPQANRTIERRIEEPAEPDELAEAFAVVGERKKPSQRDTPAPFDRGIYVIDRAQKVSGGLPTHGRRR